MDSSINTSFCANMFDIRLVAPPKSPIKASARVRFDRMEVLYFRPDRSMIIQLTVPPSKRLSSTLSSQRTFLTTKSFVELSVGDFVPRIILKNGSIGVKVFSRKNSLQESRKAWSILFPRACWPPQPFVHLLTQQTVSRASVHNASRLIIYTSSGIEIDQ